MRGNNVVLFCNKVVYGRYNTKRVVQDIKGLGK